jgi:hypothetical protein
MKGRKKNEKIEVRKIWICPLKNYAVPRFERDELNQL